MFVLYGLPSCAGLRSSSPWVMKVELAMCYLGLDYELKQPDILRIPSAVPTPVSYTHLTLPTIAGV